MQESQNPERDKEDDNNIDNELNIDKFHTQHGGKYKMKLVKHRRNVRNRLANQIPTKRKSNQEHTVDAPLYP